MGLSCLSRTSASRCVCLSVCLTLHRPAFYQQWTSSNVCNRRNDNAAGKRKAGSRRAKSELKESKSLLLLLLLPLLRQAVWTAQSRLKLFVLSLFVCVCVCLQPDHTAARSSVCAPRLPLLNPTEEGGEGVGHVHCPWVTASQRHTCSLTDFLHGTDE